MVSVAGHTSGTDLSENFRRGVDPKDRFVNVIMCDMAEHEVGFESVQELDGRLNSARKKHFIQLPYIF